MSADISNPAHATSGQCIYSTVGHIPETTETEKSTQSSHPYRLAAVCLGLLCALLLASTLILCALYLMVPKSVPEEFTEMERELEEHRACHSRGTEVERKNINMAFFAMLEKKYKYLDQYCSLNSNGRECKPCPQGWEQFSSRCYLFYAKEKKWFDSRDECRQQGADLVIIESEEEQEFITNNTRAHPHWIGLSDFEQKGTWLWVDKTLLQKGFWSGEPDSHYGPGNVTQGRDKVRSCVVTVPDENKWKNGNCFSPHKFVCETEALLL